MLKDLWNPFFSGENVSKIKTSINSGWVKLYLFFFWVIPHSLLFFFNGEIIVLHSLFHKKRVLNTCKNK